MDFFAEGFGEEAGVKFSKQQEQFLENKLPFLDPDNNKIIQFGRAVQLLGCSKLSPNELKKIMQNLSMFNKGTLTYDQMKKIFRGVALAQNRIEPSLINIQANIKTKHPVFYDDDDDEDDQDDASPPPPPVINAQPKKEAPPPTHKPPQPQPQSRPAPKQTANQSQSKPSSGQNDQIRKFEQFWSTLSLEHNDKISGNEVKKLFGNSNNRSVLSKIWKLCNISLKGYLTKGQLFIFVMLIKSKSNDLPSKLSSQMKQIIQRIDGHGDKPELVKQNNSQLKNSHFFDESLQNPLPNKSAQQEKMQKADIKKNRSSSDFDDFADFGAFGKPKKETSINIPPTQQKIPSNQPPPVQNLKLSTTSFENRPKIPKSPTFPQIPQQLQQKAPEVHPLNQGIPQQLYTRVLNELKNIQTNIYPKMQQLSNSHRQSNQILQQTNLMLNSFEQVHEGYANGLIELKKNQDDLNFRLNQTCIRMRDVIVKQSDFIKQLLQCINQQANMDLERVEVLESYTGQANQEIDENIANFKQNKKYRPSIEQKQTYVSSSETNQDNQQKSYGQQQPQQYDQTYRKSLESMKEMTMSMSISNRRKQQMGSVQESVDSRRIRQMYGEQNPPQQLRQKLKNNQMKNVTYTQNDEEESDREEEKPRNFNKGQYYAEYAETQPVNHQNKIKRTDSQEEQLQDNNNHNQQNNYNNQGHQQHEEAANLPIQTHNPPSQQSAPVSQQQQQPSQKHQQNQNPQEDEILRIKKKQVFTIQLINYLAPIKEEEYPVILQKVTGMTQNQLDALYAQLYKKYQEKMQQQKSAQQQPNINPPTQDQFSTNNFKKYDVENAQVHQNKNKQEQANFFE